MSEILNKFEQSLEPRFCQESQLRIKVELGRRKLQDGERIRKILRILDSDQVSLLQKEQILKAFIPSVKNKNMDLK